MISPRFQPRALSSTDFTIPADTNWRQLRARHEPDFNKPLIVPFRDESVLRRKPWQVTIQPILADIRDLMIEEDCDGYVFRPSEHASNSLKTLIGYVYIHDGQLAERLPKPFISPDGSGGIRVEWSVGERTVSLWHPSSPSARGYIYHSAGDRRDVDRNLSSATLTRWLLWLLGA